MSGPGPFGFPSIELGQPGKPPCPDNYTPASEVRCGGARKLRVQTSEAYVYLQLGVGLGGVTWGPEQPLQPSVGTIVASFDAVRVRNYVAGKPAQVILTPLA